MAYVASDIMSRDVFCVDKSADLRDLAKLFLANKITGRLSSTGAAICAG
jgi:hypothetical protein